MLVRLKLQFFLIEYVCHHFLTLWHKSQPNTTLIHFAILLLLFCCKVIPIYHLSPWYTHIKFCNYSTAHLYKIRIATRWQNKLCYWDQQSVHSLLSEVLLRKLIVLNHLHLKTKANASLIYLILDLLGKNKSIQLTN